MGLGEDLALLALARRRGDVRQDASLAAALVVARLITLAEEGRIGLDGERVVLRDAAPADATGTQATAAPASTASSAGPNPVPTSGLDPVFDQVRFAAKGVSVRELIEHRAEPARVARCVQRLAADGVVRLGPDPADPGRLDTLIEVSDHAAVRVVVARLRTIAAADGQLSAQDVAFGALAQVAGLDRRVLCGPLRMRARSRLARLSEQRSATRLEPDRTVRALVRFAVRAVREGAVLRARYEEAGSMAIPLDPQVGIRVGMGGGGW